MRINALAHSIDNNITCCWDFKSHQQIITVFVKGEEDSGQNIIYHNPDWVAKNSPSVSLCEQRKSYIMKGIMTK